MKILTVLGARPQFIKSVIISNQISDSTFLKEIVVHTGQHFEHNMSDIYFQEMNLSKPNYNLGINRMNRELMIKKMIEKLCPILISEKPDAVLVYGDTNSTLAGSLAAEKLKIPIFHIESGLRSFNKSMPEELNRVKTDQLSSLLFCPTENSVNNLTKEGITEGVFLSGDVMYDIFRMFSRKLLNNVSIKSNEGFAYSIELLVKAKHLNLKIIEVPSVWIEREDRKSSFKIIKWSKSYIKWYLLAFFR